MEVKLSKKEHDIVTACLNGNVDTVEQLLKEGVNAGLVYDERQNTLLIAAVRYNKFLVAKKLIEYGADVNAKNFRGETALMVSCSELSDNDDIINLLLDNGAKVNDVSLTKDSALMLASINSKVLAVKILVERGADVNIRNREGETALSKACRTMANNYDVVELLVDSGSDVNNRDNYGCNPLIWASLWARDRKDKIIEKLLENGADVNYAGIPGKNENTALMCLCRNNNLDMVKKILEYGANPNQNGGFGSSPLTAACKVNNIDMVRELIKYGADVNKVGELGKTPLIMASEVNNKEMVRELLELGATLENTDNRGCSALTCACRNRNLDIIKEILDHTANISNLTQEAVDFITENLSDYTTIKILTAILNRDAKEIDNYLNEYCNLRNIDVNIFVNKGLNINKYKDYVKEFHKANTYVKSLKNSKEVRALRLETRDLKEYIQNTQETRYNKEQLKEMKEKLNCNKKILESIRKFENNISDIVNIKLLKPIYFKKNVKKIDIV